MAEQALVRSKPRTSQWPVPRDSVRYVIPSRIIAELSEHPLTCDLYPRAFGHYRRASGHRMERKHHDDNLLIYCTEGHGHLEVAGHQFRVDAGDLLLLPSGTPHRYSSDEKQPWTVHWVHYAGPLAEAFRQHMDFGEGHLRNVGRDSRLMVDFSGLLTVRQTGFRTEALVHVSNRLRQLLAAVSLCREGRPSRDNLSLDVIHGYMQDHLGERITLQELANLTGLSPAHFATRYRKLTGVAPIQHFLHLKVEQACQLLDTTDLSLLAISNELGYDDSYYFSRLFKKVMGQSPRNYRCKNTH